ncbi:MAG: hypothetical protein ACREX4_21295 [Gammaproteobacteria bacterium]
MDNQQQLKAWLQSQCPTVWSLLNIKAQRTLPSGFVIYLTEGDHKEIAAGKQWLQTVERHLSDLISLCSYEVVAKTYRRDLSGVHTESQLAELFCEVSLCASLGKLAQSNPRLRPPSGKGTYCDVAVTLAGSDVYCEAKRYADQLPTVTGPDARSIVKSPSGQKPQDVMRPRFMDLQSKLAGVPGQFPDGTANILFVFHPSVAESVKYVQQALFGESTFFVEPAEVRVQVDGLFAADAWRTVSACYLVRSQLNTDLVWSARWQNPQALVPIPDSAHQMLDLAVREGPPACGRPPT